MRFIFGLFGRTIISIFRVSQPKAVRAGALCLCFAAMYQPSACASQDDANDPVVGVETTPFGGPIIGSGATADVNYYVTGPEPSVTLSATSGQPSGVTYQWSVSGPLVINGSSTGSTVSVSGTAPGSAGSGTVNLTYALVTNTASAPAYTVNVHEPSKVASVPGQGNPANQVYGDTLLGEGYGFQGEAVQWQLLDQVGRPMVGETVTENWNNEALNNATIGLKAPLTGGQTTIAPSGSFPFNMNGSWTTKPANESTGLPDGAFDIPDGFQTLKWGFNASGTLVWNFTTGSMALFTAQHQFIDHGTVINHQTNWSTFHNDEPNDY